MDKSNKSLSVWHEKNYYKWYRFRMLFKHLIGNFKGSYQRIRYGFNYYDAYDIQSWFGNLMPAILRHFAEITVSYPAFYEDIPEEAKANGVDENFIAKNHGIELETGEDTCDNYKKWQKILREMADCFEHGSMDFYDSSFYNPDTDDISKNFKFEEDDTGHYVQIKEDNDAWESHKKHEMEFNKWRREELHHGFELMEKYYYDLWD